jgi:hypothetical protein
VVSPNPDAFRRHVVKGSTFLSLLATDIKGKYKLTLDAAKVLALKAAARL